MRVRPAAGTAPAAGGTRQSRVPAGGRGRVIRMLPVVVALAGARLGRPAVLFVGCFGPRGLASVVFGPLALEYLAEPVARPAVTVIAFTVLLSILAHGLTADPLASRYGSGLTPPGVVAPAGLAEMPERRLIRRTRPGEQGNH